MKYYPVYLRIEGKPCLVVGGGRVASRKAAGLLAAGARLTVISPELTPELSASHQRGEIAWKDRRYQTGDAAGFFLVMAATNDEEAQRLVHADAEEHQILLNVADVPKRCNFILPALVRRGPLSIAVSTSGNSPALAKQLRLELEDRIGREYEILCELMGLLRPVILDRGGSQRENEETFNRLLGADVRAAIAAADGPALVRHVERLAGIVVDDDLKAGIVDLLA